MTKEKDKGQTSSAQSGTVTASSLTSGDSVADASDQLEEMLQEGLHAILVRLKIADESDPSNPVLALMRNHPVLSVGAATLVGSIAGLAIRRFNPLKGRK